MGNKKGSAHQAQNGSTSGLTSPNKSSKSKQKAKGPERSWKRRVWTKVEASLWIIGAAFFLYRGDGIYNLPDVIRLDDNVDRCASCTYSMRRLCAMSMEVKLPGLNFAALTDVLCACPAFL